MAKTTPITSLSSDSIPLLEEGAAPATDSIIICLGIEKVNNNEYSIVEAHLSSKTDKIVSLTKSAPISLTLALYNLKMRGANTWLLDRI